MDPLSIAAGAAGLAAFAGNVAKLVYKTVQKYRDVDQDIEVLVNEIYSLSNSLVSIGNSKKSPTFISSVLRTTPGNESRKRLDYIHTILEDCKNTLKDLETLLYTIHTGNEISQAIARKPTIALKLHLESQGLGRLRRRLDDYRSVTQIESQVLDL